MAGRNTKLTEEVQVEFTRLIAQGIFVRQACEFIGVSEQTIYNWMARGSAEVLRLENNHRSKLLTKKSLLLSSLRQSRKQRTQQR